MVVLGALAAAGGRLTLLVLKPLINILFSEEVATGTPGGASLLDRFSENWLDPFLADHQIDGMTAEASAVLLLVGFMVVSAVVFAVMQYFFLRLSRMIGVWMVVDVRQKLAEHLLRLPTRFHASRRLGDMVSRMTTDVGTSLRLLNILVEELIQGPFNILATLFLAYSAAPKATLGMLIFIPLLAIPVMKIGPRVRRRSLRSQQKLGDTTQALMQMLTGIRVVKAFRLEAREANGFRRINDEFIHQTDRMVKAQALSQGFTSFLAHAGIGLVVGALAAMQLRGYRIFSDAGSMTVFFLGIGTMFAHVKRLTKAVSNIYVSLGATERLFEVLDLETEVEDDSGQAYAGLQRSIRFERVGFDYGAGEGEALSGIDFEVRSGERVALVGSSGAGKSTLLDLLARFHAPTSGRILVDGEDLQGLAKADWLDHLAVVSQSPFLFQSSLAENVRVGRPGASDEDLLGALDAAHLSEFIARLPDGVDTQVGELGTRLSGGQAQRVTIARALLKDAEILLLDEATSALDSEAERKVQSAIESLLRGRTAFVIAHRLSTIQHCDRILVLEQGCIVEQGAHDELLKEGGAYARMWQLQSGREAPPA